VFRLFSIHVAGQSIVDRQDRNCWNTDEADHTVTALISGSGTWLIIPRRVIDFRICAKQNVSP